LVSDRTDRVGCAISRFIEWDPQYKRYMKNLLMACDYSFTNIYQQHVYETGPTASNCSTGGHYVYKGLCTALEPINPYEDFFAWWLPRYQYHG
jgi:hypothetical protein